MSDLTPMPAAEAAEPLRLTLTLHDLAPTGEAVGRVDGLVVFVPYALPGETVTVTVVERRRSFARARLEAILTPAPTRTEPACRYFGRCGGCEWQHLPYAAQVAQKTAAVRTQLARVGGLTDAPVADCIPSPTPYGYRNHARLARHSSGLPAYRAAASNDLIPVDDCPILEPALNAQLHAAAAQGLTHPGEWEVRVAGPIQVGDFRYVAGEDAFFQVNTAVAARLVQEVLAALAPTPDHSVLDLYCGVGLFTLPLGLAAGRVVGVEASDAATRDARTNLGALRGRLGSRPLPKILTAPVACALTQPPIRGRQWDGVVVDPPRAGLDAQTRTQLLALAPARLVYVSCDPATLARDLGAFTAAGYQLRAVQPLDMFPQTHHVETVATLVRA